MKTWQLILSVIVFQVTWISAAFSYELVALIGLLGLILLLKFSEVDAGKILISSNIAILTGVAMDASLYSLGVYDFPGSHILFYLNVPVWLLIMWAAFSTTLFSSLYWSLDKPLIFIPLCALSGPLSYLAGREIGIIAFTNESLLIMVVGWFIWSCLFLLLWHFLFKKISLDNDAPAYLEKK